MDVLRRFEGELGRLGAAKIAPPALRPVLGNNYGEDLAGNREVAWSGGRSAKEEEQEEEDEERKNGRISDLAP